MKGDVVSYSRKGEVGSSGEEVDVGSGVRGSNGGVRRGRK